MLVASTDPAHSLGDALGAELGPEPVPVPGAPGLLAVEIDGPGAFRRWFEDRREPVARILDDGTLLERSEIDRLLDLPLPGVDELIGLLELLRLARGQELDRVVVDTAPTGHTLRLLDSPRFLDDLARLLATARERETALRQAFGGRADGDREDATIRDLEETGRELLRLLRDPERTELWWVLLPERLPLEETRDALRALGELGLGVSRLVVSRMPPPDAAGCSRCRRRADAAATVVDLLRDTAPAPVLLVPERDDEPIGPPALAALARPLRARLSPGGERPLDEGGGGAEGDLVERPPDPPAPTDRSPPAKALRGPGPFDSALAAALPGPGKLLLVAGKGGVGKTTVAAALGLGLAAAGRETLLLSTDPAHSLGDVLEQPLGHGEVAVADHLAAREIDPDTELLDWVGSIDPLTERLSAAGMEIDRRIVERLVATAPPGLDELASLAGLLEAVESDRTVVVDTAPTGHFLRLLEAPELGLAWVRTLLGMQLRTREVLGLGELAEKTLRLSRRLKALRERLADPERCGVWVVLRPGRLPLAESGRLLASLDRLGAGAGAIVVNGLVGASPCPRCRSRRRTQERSLGATVLRKGGRAIIVAPEEAPPPTGPWALTAFSSRWRLLSGAPEIPAPT